MAAKTKNGQQRPSQKFWAPDTNQKFIWAFQRVRAPRLPEVDQHSERNPLYIFKLVLNLLYLKFIFGMHFTTAGKTYGSPQDPPPTHYDTAYQESSGEASNSVPSGLEQELRLPGLGDSPLRPSNNYNDSTGLNVQINRVSSKEYLERKRQLSSDRNEGLSTSLKNFTSLNQALDKLSTSVDKRGSNYSGSYRQINKEGSSNYGRQPTYSNFAPTKKSGGLDPDYADQNGSENGDNEVMRRYKQLQNLNLTVNMVSSVISRESDAKSGSGSQRVRFPKQLSTSSRGRNDEDIQNQVYNLYSSRHPNDSIRKSTIEISKAISSNAIQQLQRQNQNQSKSIKKLERQVQEYKGSVQKWQDVKHKYQIELESKSRQIFDLERANQTLTEEVQSLRTYRTMETVEQVVITKLKEQVMLLNKKIVEMQAEHYKNQRLLIEKYQKGQIPKLQEASNVDREAYSKLEINFETAKKQVELLEAEIKKEKEKSWKLERQQEQNLSEKTMITQSLDRQIKSFKRQIEYLNSEIQKYIGIIRTKESEANDSTNRFNAQIQKLNDRIKSNQAVFEAKLKQKKEKDETEHRKASQQKLEQEVSKRVSENKKILEKQIAQREEQFNRKFEEQRKTFENLIIEKEKQRSPKKVVNPEIESKYNQAVFEIGILKKENSAVLQRLNENVAAAENLRRQNVWLQESIKQNTTEIANLRKENSDLTKKITQSGPLVETLRKQNAKLVQNLNQTAFELGNLRKQASRLQDKIKEGSSATGSVENLKKQNSTLQQKLNQSLSEVEALRRQNGTLSEKINQSTLQTSTIRSQISKADSKYTQCVGQLSTLKSEMTKLEQKSAQSEIQLNRARQSTNIWKAKAENLEKTKVEAAAFQQQRETFKTKIRELEQNNSQNQALKKYQILSSEHDKLKQQLKIKEDQISAFAKVKENRKEEEQVIANLLKEVKTLESKVIETESKFKTILSKVELEEYKYQQIAQKLATDSKVYLDFIKKLQEDNELVHQRYSKVRRLCLTNKIKVQDDDQAHEKVDYSTFRQYIEKEIYSQITKMVIPSIESKILQKISACETSLALKYRKMIQIKHMAEKIKRKRAALKK